MGYRKRQRSSGPVSQSDEGMDSFVDVICNTIGVLVVIIIFSAVIAQRISKMMKAPEWRPFEEKVVHVFEARSDTVYYLNRPALLKKVTDKLASLSSLAQDKRQELLAETQIYSGNHLVVAGDLNVGVVTVQLIPNTTGGTAGEEINKPFSLFNKYLANLNPEKDELHFIVCPSGDAAFRLARRQARSLEFEVSFDLRGEDDPITFGLGSAIGASR